MAQNKSQDIESKLTLIIPLLFFASGSCGLVYQVVWARMLSVAFGTTSLAISTVLSSFMAGLALGSYVFGKWIDGRQDSLRIFGFLEIGIGIFAILLPNMIAVLETAYPWFPDSNFYVMSLVRFGVCFTLLLIPTAFMGGTLPVISRTLVRRFSRFGADIGRLYAINTFGAVVGIIIVTFYLMEEYGLQGTIYVTACGNFIVGGLACWLGRTQAEDEKTKVTSFTSNDTADTEAPPSTLKKTVLVGFCLSGFAALGYEVAWTRLLTVAFAANSQYEFSIILISFLLGLSMGSFFCSRFLHRNRDLLTAFASIEILIGLMALLSVPVFSLLPGWIAVVKTAESWWGFRGGIFAISIATITFPTLLMGAAFPLVSRICTSGLDTAGRGIGTVGAANSLGSIGGAFTTGFLLMPLFGTETSVQILAMLNIGVGLIIAHKHPEKDTNWKRKTGLAALLATVTIVLLTPSDVLVKASSTSRDAELVHYEEGIAGVVTVDKSTDGYRRLMVNGGGQVPSDYASVQLFRLLGHLPMLLHPNPQDVLVIAFGGGIALGSVSQHNAQRIECVEIVPEVMNAAHAHFSEFNHNILDSLTAANVKIIADDGRNYLLRSRNTYDVITGDATHPTSADSWVLYTRDFYQLCKDHLSENGIMAQWLPLHALAPQDYKTILRTFQTVFPNASLWLTNDYTVILGTIKPLRLDFNQLEQKLKNPNVGNSLREVDLSDPFAVLSCFAMDANTLRKFVGNGPLNTDDHPYISYIGERGFRRSGWKVLREVGKHRIPVFPLLQLENSTVPAVEIEQRLESYYRGKEHILQADILRMRKRGMSTLAAYRKALSVNPEDQTAAFFVTHFSDQLISQFISHLQTQPKDFESRWKLGNEYARSGQWEKAKQTFEKLTELAPRFLKGYLSLSLVHANQGNDKEAFEVLGYAQRLATDSEQAQKSIKTAYAEIQKRLGKSE